MDSRMPDCRDSSCSICHENESIHSVGKCDHHVCFKCSTRMRVLMGHSYCPICRAVLEKIVLTRKKMRFTEASACALSHLDNIAYGISFEDEQVQQAFNKLLLHCCNICKDGCTKPFLDFSKLKDHMRKEHERFYCDVCEEHVKQFSWERKNYTRALLAQHRRKGDPDDSSHKGHPLCKFCDKRFLDNDELWRHLRKDHFFCHICDADGKHLFFHSYEYVRQHFKSDHFLCEEGDCEKSQFTNVFRSDIDFRAHKAQQHAKHMSKGALRQTRTLDLPINYGPPRHRSTDYENAAGEELQRRAGGSARGISKATTEDDELVLAMKLSKQQSDVESRNGNASAQFSADDFPNLGSASAGARSLATGPPSSSVDSMARRFARMNNYTISEGDARDGRVDDFPALTATRAPAPIKKTPTGAAAASTVTAATKVKDNAWNSIDQEFPALSGANASAYPLGAPPGWTKVPKSKSKHPAPHKAQKLLADDFPSLLTAGAESLTCPLGKWVSKSSSAQPSLETTKPKGQSGSSAANGVSGASAISTTAAAPAASEEIDSVAQKGKGKKKNKKKGCGLDVLRQLESGLMHHETVTDEGRRDTGDSAHMSTECNKLTEEVTASADSGYAASNRAKHTTSTNSAVTSGKPFDSASQEQTSPTTSVHQALPTSGESCFLPVDSDSYPALPCKGLSVPPPGFFKAPLAGLQTGLKDRTLSDLLPIPPSVAGPTNPPAAVKCSLADIANFISPQQQPPLGLEESPCNTENVVVLTSGVPTARPSSAASARATNGSVAAPIPASLVDIANFISPRPAPPPGLGGTPYISTKSRPIIDGAAPRSVLPPPGLAMSFHPLGAAVNQPQLEGSTFSTLEGCGVSESHESLVQFIKPTDFLQRNSCLTATFKKIVADCSDLLDAFKTMSGRFRSNIISAADFYEGCISLVGSDAFAGIFPELLVLLPDVYKQQELLQAHNHFIGKVGSSETALAALSADELFVVCDVCCQVLARPDAVEHRAYHSSPHPVVSTGTDDFPPLSVGSAKGPLLKNWVKKV